MKIAPACGKGFKSKKLLRDHMKSHSEERPYCCQEPGCDWRFSTSSKLRRHEKSHSESRNYVCKTCTKAYKRSEHLRKHEIVHRVQKFCCGFDWCGKSNLMGRKMLSDHLSEGHKTAPAENKKYRCLMEKCGRPVVVFHSFKEFSHHMTTFHQTDFAVAPDESDLTLDDLLSFML